MGSPWGKGDFCLRGGGGIPGFPPPCMKPCYVHVCCFADLAVSAPYERSSSTQNTGTVYIYYGRDTKEEFESQIPQKVRSTCTQLRNRSKQDYTTGRVLSIAPPPPPPPQITYTNQVITSIYTEFRVQLLVQEFAPAAATIAALTGFLQRRVYVHDL